MPAATHSREAPGRFNPYSQSNRPQPAQPGPSQPPPAQPNASVPSAYQPYPSAAPPAARPAVFKLVSLALPEELSLEGPEREFGQWLSRKRMAILPRCTDPNTAITILTNPPNESFVFPTELACRHSSVMNAMINGPTQIRAFHMQGASTYNVFLLLEWLCHQTITIRTLCDDFVPGDEVDGIMFATLNDRVALLWLWVAADHLHLPALQNLALKSLDTMLNTFRTIHLGEFRWLYDNTRTKKPCLLRDYYVAQITENLSKAAFDTYGHMFPREFLLDVAYLFLIRASRYEPEGFVEQYFVPEGV